MTSKKSTPDTKQKSPPKPKFGEVGYEFKVNAKIVEVNDVEGEIFFQVLSDLGEFSGYDDSCDGVCLTHITKQDLIKLVANGLYD